MTKVVEVYHPMEVFSDLCSEHGVIYKDKKLKFHHLKTRHSHEMVECDLCRKSFSSKKDLTVHITKDKHSEQKFTCEQCGQSFAKKANVK